ncbi:PREDICTED: uncharacterized protein LOC109584765 [Amphimedon queenslandica]|uniref:Uncharacterized protein n=1 Tax=Amphimedon queenslandica TaxID=400682 RepID=A0A1X7U4Z1_AMPQE|nr:PREDICTED: uncharacterized protein LOC109584765 [Amphimedon queenslandica]|eukprot:XP_019856172.1 PREDICTED: uncharacterized protein LOC109584765 [Amphimedon queenslandica]
MFGVFSSVFGKDCSEIERDPRADPFDKEICRTMRQFEESFEEMTDFFEREDSNDEQCYDESPELLRGNILNKDDFHCKSQFKDKNLDDIVEADPKALDDILNSRGDKRNNTSGRVHSQSIRISTTVRPDGTVEYKRTVTDSDGNEQTTTSSTKRQ